MSDKFTTRYVSADPPARVEVLPPTTLPPAPITEPMPHSSHLDRARAFTLATAPLAATTGLVVLLIAVVAFGVPLLSILALLVALGGFGLIWAVSFIVFTFVSPDGALLAHVLLMWAYLKREQRNRFDRYRNKP